MYGQTGMSAHTLQHRHQASQHYRLQIIAISKRRMEELQCSQHTPLNLYYFTLLEFE